MEVVLITAAVSRAELQLKCHHQQNQHPTYYRPDALPVGLPRWLSGLSQCAPTGTACRGSRGSIPGTPVDFMFGFQGRML